MWSINWGSNPDKKAPQILPIPGSSCKLRMGASSDCRRLSISVASSIMVRSAPKLYQIHSCRRGPAGQPHFSLHKRTKGLPKASPNPTRTAVPFGTNDFFRIFNSCLYFFNFRDFGYRAERTYGSTLTQCTHIGTSPVLEDNNDQEQSFRCTRTAAQCTVFALTFIELHSNIVLVDGNSTRNFSETTCKCRQCILSLGVTTVKYYFHNLLVIG